MDDLFKAKANRDKLLAAQKKRQGKALKKKSKHSSTASSISILDVDENSDDEDVVVVPTPTKKGPVVASPSRASGRSKNCIIPYVSMGE